MKKTLLAFFIACLIISSAGQVFANQNDETSKILAAAENVFIKMKNKDYKAIWDGLTVKTKEIIVNDVYKASKKMDIEVSKDELKKDFGAPGPSAKAYWDSYLNVFNPILVLEECNWAMGEIKKDKAEIYVLHKKSERPALLKMYKENSEWKLGLEESFGARKLTPF
jgi:hypothetical protein